MGRALVEYVEPGTRATYDRATWTYVTFCQSRDVNPWPVTRWSFCLWMWNQALWIAMSSLTKVYMGAVKSSQLARGEPWTLDRDPMVRRVVIALKKKWGMPSKAKTAAMSLKVIWALAQRIPGFPRAAAMSHDDRLWLFASVLGCLGLLRGGEFLVSAKQSRPVLKGKEIVIEEMVAGKMAVIVRVPKPKARWWEPHMPVTIFGLPGTPLDVVRLCKDYRELSLVALRPLDPALRRSNGDALSKSWMFAETERKLFNASMLFRDELGRAMRIGAKAWRYGGSASHDAAAVAPKVKQAHGRWLTSAVLCYAPVPQSEDFLQATELIWNDVIRDKVSSVGMGVGVTPSDVMDDDTSPDVASPGVRAEYLARALSTQAKATVKNRKVGDIVNTKWGKCTLVSEAAGGGFHCSWVGEKDLWHMAFHYADACDLAPSSRKRDRSDDITDVSSVVR